MRSALLRLLGEDARLQSSYLPGRSGFVVTSTRSLEDLRQALIPRWACRLYALHADSGRLFLEPSAFRLAEALISDDLDWWSPAHQKGAGAFFDAARGERVRRLPGASRVPSTWTRGFKELRELALRLEALRVTPRADKHWRGLARSFDALWVSTALYAAPRGNLSNPVFDYLRRCQQHEAQRRGKL